MAREYKRIGGRGSRRRQIFTRNTLWLGADHLLQVENTGYSEEYKRFYFRDIQSITVQKDSRYLFWSLIFAAFLAACLAFLASVQSVEARYSWGFASGLFGLLLLVNLVKGPSCYTRIKTAVQEEELPAFRRVSKTQKALAHIREMIAAAQGTMAADEIRARLASSQSLAGMPSPRPSPAAPPQNVAPPPPPVS